MENQERGTNQLPPLNIQQNKQQNENRRKKKLEKLRQDKHATTIQAFWRGNKIRKKLKQQKQYNGNNNKKGKVEEEDEEKKEENKNEINNKNTSYSLPLSSPSLSLSSSPKNENIITSPTANNNTNISDEKEEKNQPVKKSKSQSQIIQNHNNNNIEDSHEQRPKSEQIPKNSNNNMADEKQKYNKDLDVNQSDKKSTPELIPSINKWPINCHDNFINIDESIGIWPDLTNLKNNENNLNWIFKNKKILLRTITWNMCANKPPPVEEIQKLLLPRDKFHLVVIGTEECERSIAKSAVNPSKKNWESYLIEAMGTNYTPLRSHTLQAIHIMLFAHQSIISLISNVTSAAIACGMANTLGNKGGVGLSFEVGTTRIVVINTHLAANQNQTETRNLQFCKICSEIVPIFKRNLNQKIKNEFNNNNNNNNNSNSNNISNTNNNNDDDDETSIVEPIPPELIPDSDEQGMEPGGDEEEVIGNDGAKENSNVRDKIEEYICRCDELDRYGDRIIFMGDMNYRINGNRRIVDQLLSLEMHEVLLSNDQLKMSMLAKQLPSYFKEANLTFHPTYKYDPGSNKYDTSSKKRIPSWTDRILFKQTGLKCLVYNSVTDIMISDHRPVYGSFLVDIDVNLELQENSLINIKESNNNNSNTKFSSESQVCNIM